MFAVHEFVKGTPINSRSHGVNLHNLLILNIFKSMGADLTLVSAGMLSADNTPIATMMDDGHGADDENPAGRCKTTEPNPAGRGRQ